MEIPFRKVVWNEHETALLIEIYEKVQCGVMSRNTAESQLSNRLRNAMLNDGIAINDKYRNISGISLQLNLVERYMSDGDEGFGQGNISKMFSQIIALKQETPDRYDSLLNEANLLYPIVEESEYTSDKQLSKDDSCSESLTDKTGECSFEWNKYEAALIINTYKLISNNIIDKQDACSGILKRFSHSSALVGRRIVPTEEELHCALDDIQKYDKGEIDVLYKEIESMFGLYSSNATLFRVVHDSATKLYPIEASKSIISIKREGKKEELLSEKEIDTPTVIPAIDVTDSLKSDDNTIESEVTKIEQIVEGESTEEENTRRKDESPYTKRSIVTRANSSYLVSQFKDQYNIAEIRIEHFFTIKGDIYHIVPYHQFVKNGRNSTSYSIFKKRDGNKYAAWRVLDNDCNDEEILELLLECYNYKNSYANIVTNIQSNKSNRIIEIESAANIVQEDSFEYELTNNVDAYQQRRTESPKTKIVFDEKIKSVLVDNFIVGYRLGSNMDRKRFANFYYQKFNEELSIDGELLYKEILKCGIVIGGSKLYVPDAMLDVSTKKELFEYIDKQFQDGLEFIYYNVLFKDFNDRFLGQKILDDSMLKEYLIFFNKNSYYQFCDSYITTILTDTNIDIDQKVMDYVREQGCSVTEEDVIHALSFIPENQIHDSFNGNKYILLTCGRGQRFHISNFQLEEEDKQTVIDYLYKEIKDMKFVSFLELIDKMKAISPRVVDNNIQFSETGIRSALSVLLGDHFYFRGGIISDKKNPISIQDAFFDFARGRKSFTVEETQLMANDFGTLINYEALAIKNVRVSEDMYVSKDSISFPVDEVDNAVEMFCIGDFISIQEISTFTAFPECGYKWNEYLLESYIYNISRTFNLLHNRFNKTSVSGAIVRKISKYDDYNEVIAAALSSANVSLEKKSTVLDYLSDNGFIARRQYDGIEQVINRAKKIKTI